MREAGVPTAGLHRIAFWSGALIADPRETLACAFLSARPPRGLAANFLLGIWQADRLAGLLIILFLLREGYGGWRVSDGEPEGDMKVYVWRRDRVFPLSSPGLA